MHIRFAPLLFTLFLLLACPAAAGTTGLAPRAIDEMAGESRRYALDFLFFSHLAEGELHLSKTDQPDIFRAMLIGRTLGVAAWLTGDRTQSYVSLMRKRPDGRLQTIEHTSRIIKRKGEGWEDRAKRYRFDYLAGRVVRERNKTGPFRFDKEYELSEGSEAVDMLTAFYNLRAGVYGRVTAGRQLAIPTFSGKGATEIKIVVLTRAEQKKHAFFPAGGVLLKVTIDPEVFETSGGDLYVWFDDKGDPLSGIVEDVIGMGDVRGRLITDDAGIDVDRNEAPADDRQR